MNIRFKRPTPYEEVLKPYVPQPQQSTAWTRFKARLQYNKFTKWYLSATRPSQNSLAQLTELKFTKYHYHAMFVSAMIAMCSFYIQLRNTQIRKSTFVRNQAAVEQKYGELHRESLGKDAKISKYGYPDIGNNLYADLLPYRDWVRVNNAQRCHENLVASQIILYPNAFLGMLVYPRVTLGFLYIFLIFRIWHIQGYLSFRGHNKAFASEEFSKLALVCILGTSILASLSILGVTQKLAMLKRFVPARIMNLRKKQ